MANEARQTGPGRITAHVVSLDNGVKEYEGVSVSTPALCQSIAKTSIQARIRLPTLLFFIGTSFFFHSFCKKTFLYKLYHIFQ